MKRLTLLRHAKSTWDDLVACDFDRPLNPRGRRAARTVGREMRRLKMEFDRVIASPAARVKETIEEVSAGYGSDLAPDFDRRIYLASAESLLELVQGTDDRAETLLIVGHNPGLENLALHLAEEGPSELRSQILIKYPTATLAQITLPIDDWGSAKEGIGTLDRFIRPRDLDPELGPDEDS